jgi:hypothetical protein
MIRQRKVLEVRVVVAQVVRQKRLAQTEQRTLAEEEEEEALVLARERTATVAPVDLASSSLAMSLLISALAQEVRSQQTVQTQFIRLLLPVRSPSCCLPAPQT